MISASNHMKTSVATDALNLPPGFALEQRHVNIFNDEDLHMNLLSTGQICETGTHKVIFDDKHCDVVDRRTNNVVMRGSYDCSTWMYKMPMTRYNNQTNTVAHSMIPIPCNPLAALCVYQDNRTAVPACSAYKKQAVPALI